MCHLSRRILPFSIGLATFAMPAAHAAPVHLVDQPPSAISEVAPGLHLVDFGRVAFGNLRLNPPAGAAGSVTVHFGESLLDGRINRTPPGSVRYRRTEVTLGGVPIVVEPPEDQRRLTQNSGKPPFVVTPPEWGVVTPFRWVEVEGWPGEFGPQAIVRRAAFPVTWDDDAASFHCSDDMLNRIWDLCRYSIKATGYGGVYVDGDDERVPYEADAYLNQLSHYATDNDIQMARDTFDHLMAHPTWPTEWGPHMVFMAHADWMHTGDTRWLAPRYEGLKGKMLLERAGPDGLIRSNPQQVGRDDLVDWPKGERGGFVFTSVNTVVNAFHLRSLALMAELARALGHDADAAEYSAREQATHAVFQEKLFDAARGLYRDGEGTDNASFHANMFPLAFGLVPAGQRGRIARWLASRGMVCSVYGAQYLMEALFSNDAGAEAIHLMTAATDRSWRHMIEAGATLTWEAWDPRYKPDMDWNHAWSAAPANLLPRYVLGVEASSPGWDTILIRPNTGDLTQASGKIPTRHGPILLSWENGSRFRLSVTLPSGVTARLELPAPGDSLGVTLDGQPVEATRAGSRWIVATPVVGSALFEVR